MLGVGGQKKTKSCYLSLWTTPNNNFKKFLNKFLESGLSWSGIARFKIHIPGKMGRLFFQWCTELHLNLLRNS